MNEARLSNPNALTRALGRELSPHAANVDGWTDLRYAATFDLADAADALLARGANPSSALKRDVESLDEAPYGQGAWNALTSSSILHCGSLGRRLR